MTIAKISLYCIPKWIWKLAHPHIYDLLWSFEMIYIPFVKGSEEGKKAIWGQKRRITRDPKVWVAKWYFSKILQGSSTWKNLTTDCHFGLKWSPLIFFLHNINYSFNLHQKIFSAIIDGMRTQSSIMVVFLWIQLMTFRLRDSCEFS